MVRIPAPRAAAALLVLASAAVTLRGSAQKTPETPTGQVGPVLKTVDVTVTNLDVVVTDSKGNRITGLKKEDFEVVEDGLVQTLTNFFAVEGGRLTMVGDEPVPPPAPNVPEPVDATLPTPKTRIVIFVDNLHIAPFNRNRVLKNVREFVLRVVKGDTEGMVVTWDRSLKIRRRFTNDGRDLADILRQVEEQSALGASAASERADVIRAIDEAQDCFSAEGKARSYALSMKNDLEFTIDAMKTTMNQLAGVDGRKVFIHVSDGLPQSPGAELWQYMQERFRNENTVAPCSVSLQHFEFDKTAGYLGVVQSANAAGVTIYALDAKGLEVDAGTTAEARTNKARIDTFAERGNLQAMLTLMSEETGGRAVLNANDMKVALGDIEKDVSSYYSLGYRSIRSGVDRPHEVKVRVKRKGLTARARRSYLEKSPETKITEAVQSALFFSRADNPLQVALEVGQPAPADRQNYVVPIRIRIPYSRVTLLPEGNKARGRLVFYFQVLDASGKQSDLARQVAGLEVDAAKLEQVSRSEYVYDVKLLMIPGGQKLSLAVKDDVTGTASFVQKSVFVSALPPEEKPAS